MNKTLWHYIYVKRLLQQENFDSSELISQSFPVFFEIKLEMTKIFFLTNPCAISHSPIQLITNSKELSEQGIFLVASFQISDRQKNYLLLKKNKKFNCILFISLLRKCQNFNLQVVETQIQVSFKSFLIKTSKIKNYSPEKAFFAFLMITLHSSVWRCSSRGTCIFSVIILILL